jgi:CheY-like chemotaxis protein
MDGIAATKKLQIYKETREIPVIAVSAYVKEADKKRLWPQRLTIILQSPGHGYRWVCRIIGIDDNRDLRCHRFRRGTRDADPNVSTACAASRLKIDPQQVLKAKVVAEGIPSGIDP